VARPHAGPLSRSAIAWALGGALRFAIGTAVAALLLATTLRGEAAERLATTAYLAAIFAAVAFALQRFVPAAPADEPNAVSPPTVASFLWFSVGIAIFLSVVAALVSQPVAEVLTLVAGFGLVGLAALARCGWNPGRAYVFERTAYYSAIVAVAAMLVASLLPAALVEPFAVIAYLAAVAATFAVAMKCWRRAS
jgi:hypothetical protein